MTVRLSPVSPEGFVICSHAGDDFRECRDYVRARLGLSPDAWKNERPALPGPAIRLEPSGATSKVDALALWRASVDPRNTIAERYLSNRALDLGDDVACEALRWHPGIGAMMIALFRNILTGAPQAISRTFLDADARKTGRKFLGPVGVAAVMLDGFDTVSGGLHIGEGVETCMAARQLGLRPAWALGSCGAIAAFPVLGGVECLTILAEHDDASARAVEACGGRWHAAGREVLINRPIGGKDLNDVVKRESQ